MTGSIFKAVLITLVLAAPGVAQEWAEKMFETTSHDFGTIARGSKTVYSFKLKNIYEETVHIQGVRSSCGCTEPKVVHPTLKTWETGEIVAQFNTRSFSGPHSATVTVIIDKPFPAEVRLQVQGNVRSDVVFQPGSLDFGTVDQGTDTAKRVRVKYAGRDTWQIVDVRSAFPDFEVELDEVSRGNRRVTYDLNVRLKPSAPVGYINEQLVLITDDERNPRIPLDIEGNVRPSITVSPQQMVLGEVVAGTVASKKLVVRGNQPFRILEVTCPDGCFSFEKDDESKKLHIVTVKFEPGEQTGDVKRTIHIRTDQGDAEISLDAHATIVAAAG